ncbi:Holliday junction branch migration protein RuvA [soil metagenome]
MIGRLKGIVESREGEICLLDVGGVCYELTCSLQTIDTLVLGERTRLEVFTHVREDQLALFGFATSLEKELFLALLSVNGVGPKMAIKILSAAPVSHIARSVEAGDVKALSQLPKVGKKTAEQLIVSLKGKLTPFLDSFHSGFAGASAHSAATAIPLALSARESMLHEIDSALLNLGFRPQEVERVIAQLVTKYSHVGTDVVTGNADELTLESGVRFALQTLGGMR